MTQPPPTTDQSLEIGGVRLALPADHPLPEILETHPGYDVHLWDLIGALLRENGLAETCQLIDIGANVGDTAAHFRRHASGPVWAIEAHPGYVSYLRANTAGMADIRVSEALVCPPALQGAMHLDVHDGTAASRIITPNGPEEAAADIDPDRAPSPPRYDGPVITPDQIIAEAQTPFLIKSDTDGFDGYILDALITHMERQARWPALVTFEGADLDQIRADENTLHHRALTRLAQQGYGIQLLTNVGLPIGFLGSNTQAISWQMNAHARAARAGHAGAHYFDFLCVAPWLEIRSLRFGPDASAWPP